MSALWILNSNQGLSWAVQSGYFRFAQKLILDNVVTDEQTIEQLRDATEKNFLVGGFIDMTDFTPEQFNQVASAYFQGLEQCLIEGFPDNRIPEQLMVLLKALFCVDARQQNYPVQEGYLTIANGISWHASSWVYDIVLEFLVAYGYYHQLPKPVENLLLGSRIINGKGSGDLSTVAAADFCPLKKAIIRMEQVYGEEFFQGYTHAEDFYNAVSPSIIRLYDVINADPRGESCDISDVSLLRGLRPW